MWERDGGQIAIPTARRANVCALEPSASKIRFMRAVSTQEGVRSNLWFVNSSLENVRFMASFDAVFLNGVLEWVSVYGSGDARQTQQHFLKKVRSQLKPGGCCVDYKLPKRILPLWPPDELNEFFAAGTFIPEHSGADGSKLPNQAELQSLYQTFAEMGIAHYFVPSFCILAR